MASDLSANARWIQESIGNLQQQQLLLRQQSQMQADNSVPTVLSPFTSPPSTPSGSHRADADEDCDR